MLMASGLSLLLLAGLVASDHAPPPSLLAAPGQGAKMVPQVALCDRQDCPSVSKIAMGTLHLGNVVGISNITEINLWIQAAVDIGINLFDLSDVYPPTGGTYGGSTSAFGQALALTPGLRDKIMIVAKMDIMGGYVDASTEHITSVLTWYLEKLQTDYVDILMLHMPDTFADPAAIAETFASFQALGKVRHFGLSDHKSHSYDLINKRMQNIGLPGLVTHEIELSVWNPSAANYDNDLTDHAQLNGFKPIIWGPLGGDPLGKPNRLFDPQNERGVNITGALNKVGAELGLSGKPDIVALAWLLNHPVQAIPILGTTKIDRMRSQALDALNVTLTHKQWYSIAKEGGLCFMADIQCNYKLYNAPTQSAFFV